MSELRCTVTIPGDEWVNRGARGALAVAVGHRLYLFGGYYDNAHQMTVSVFNTLSLKWTMLPPVPHRDGERPPEAPLARFGHTAVLIGDIACIWGGLQAMEEELRDNRLYGFKVDTHRWWVYGVFGRVPEARLGHSACVLRKNMYVHGGMIQLIPEVFTNDMYKLDTTTMTWSSMNPRGTLPTISAFHSATIIGTYMFVFAGVENGDGNNRVFDTVNNCWFSNPAAQFLYTLPERRYSHAAFAYNEELYIFGGLPLGLGIPQPGELPNRPCNDMWKFSPRTFSWKKVKPMGNDLFLICAGCCCMVGDRVIIFGGMKDDKVNNDLVILDFSPSLKTLCKQAVIQYALDQVSLPHDIMDESW